MKVFIEQKMLEKRGIGGRTTLHFRMNGKGRRELADRDSDPTIAAEHGGELVFEGAIRRK